MSIAELLDYGLKEVPQQSEIRTETVETNNATTDSSKVLNSLLEMLDSWKAHLCLHLN